MIAWALMCPSVGRAPIEYLRGTRTVRCEPNRWSAWPHIFIDTLRREGLRHTQFAKASTQTIRLKLLKLGAQVRTSVRRIRFALASGCSNKDEFEIAHLYLRRAFNSG
jgi:LSD1 subclass zinc finger protein